MVDRKNVWLRLYGAHESATFALVHQTIKETLLQTEPFSKKKYVDGNPRPPNQKFSTLNETIESALTPGQPKKNAENIYVYNILGFVFADPQTEVAQTV